MISAGAIEKKATSEPETMAERKSKTTKMRALSK
jgi:hypothetical protein